MDEFTKECFLRGFMLGMDYIIAGMKREEDEMEEPEEYFIGYTKILVELEKFGYPLAEKLCQKTPTEIAHDILDPMGCYDEFIAWYEKEMKRIEKNQDFLKKQ